MSKKPRASSKPPLQKQPRTVEDVSKIGLQYFCWRASNKYVDYDHADWGWGGLSCRDFFKILIDRLHEFERTSWADLEKRKSCHSMPVEKIEPKAQQRLRELFGEEIDSLYQVDINPKCRLWGHRDRTIFYLIWHDPKHSVYLV